MTSEFCRIDDKFVPLYRIIWISAVPHFCGREECRCEGLYEVRLEHGETLWARMEERDAAIEAIEQWQGGFETEDFNDNEF